MATGDTPHLYDRIKRDLRESIARRDFQPDQPFITQREICERYAVSTTTAVRALNDLVAEGILVRRRGRGTFVADQPVRAVDGIGATVSCIVHGLPGAHIADILRGVESVCSELGYRMFLADTAGSADREARALRQVLTSGAEGVVLYPVEGQANRALLEELRRRRIPVVMVDRYLTDFASPAVLADNFRLGYDLTTALIDRGHVRIGTLWSETDCTSARDRLSGHIQALRDRNLPVLPELAALRSVWPATEDVRAGVLAKLVHSATAPTALLCSNGYVLAAAAQALIRMGVDVPGDIDLASMDDAGPYDILPLTAVTAALPSHEMGQLAMRRLARLISSDHPTADTVHETLQVRIHNREGVTTYLDTLNSATRDQQEVTEQR